MLAGLQQKMSTLHYSTPHYTTNQGEDYATIGAPDTTAYQQIEMT